jgi:hypothetical protein
MPDWMRNPDNRLKRPDSDVAGISYAFSFRVVEPAKKLLLNIAQNKTLRQMLLKT